MRLPESTGFATTEETTDHGHWAEHRTEHRALNPNKVIYYALVPSPCYQVDFTVLVNSHHEVRHHFMVI